MSGVIFPPDPSDGMIFEATPGVYYEYSAGEDSWIRIDGSDTILPATPLSDGLMSSEDFQKLLNLIVPPPQATLKGEDCSYIFRRGKIGLYSNDGSLDIEPSLSLNANDASIERPWDILRNTVGIDFRLNIEQFLSEIQSRGNVIDQRVVGDKGPTGDAGDAGRDQLDTGPTGADGIDGSNSPFAGTLAPDNLSLNLDQFEDTRAIVNVSVERVSEDENYLVFTRANIGNPDACPSEIIPRQIQSPWLVISQPGITSYTKRTTLTGDCAIPCAVCSSGIYYLNIDPIMDKLFDRYKELVSTLKSAKEDLVTQWLKAMIYLFNQQKAALCCALENCRSRTRNTQTRQYIESQRIQAALGNFSLVIDGEEDRLTVDMDEYKDCAQSSTQQGEYVVENLEAGCDEWMYEITLDAAVHNRDPRVSKSNYLEVSLARGSYFMEVIGCCASIGDSAAQGAVSEHIVRDEDGNAIEVGQVMVNGVAYPGIPAPENPNAIYGYDENGNRVIVNKSDLKDPVYKEYSDRKGFAATREYTGRVAMIYQWEREVGSGNDRVSIQEELVQLPNLGKMTDESAARSSYLGLTTLFTHAGGPIKMWVPDADFANIAANGTVIIGIQKVECMESYIDNLPETRKQQAIAAGATEFSPPIYIYRGKVAATNVIGILHPYEGSLDAESNYGFNNDNAHINHGPQTEAKVIKVFFYDGSDGLSFFMVQNKANVAMNTESLMAISVRNNSSTPSILVSDNPGDLLPATSSQKRALDLPTTTPSFVGRFTLNNQTGGGVVGYLDNISSEFKEWEVVIDPLDTGELVMMKAADGKDGDEIVLAQGRIKVDLDQSFEDREPLTEEEGADAEEIRTSWGQLRFPSPPAVDADPNWWNELVGDDSTDPNPYSILDGTYGNPANTADVIGAALSITNAVAGQNIRLWRDYEYPTYAVSIVDGIDNYQRNWTEPWQTHTNIALYTANTPAIEYLTKSLTPGSDEPILIKSGTYGGLIVFAACWRWPSATFSITIIDKDGNVFEFPDRTIYRRDDYGFEWVNFGAPDDDDIVVIESDPSILEEPPSGTIIGTTVTGRFKRKLDLRYVDRIIIDIKSAYADSTGNPAEGLAIHTIAAMVKGKGVDLRRWPDNTPKYRSEPIAYAILESFARYWAYEPPADGYGDRIPDNRFVSNLAKWWIAQSVTDTWNFINDFDGESIKSPKASGYQTVVKDPTEEIKANRIVLSSIPPTDGCQMYWKQVVWLERGHRTGASCSFFVEIDGMRFIIVKRSIGVDTTCGGGESEDNPCVSAFINAGEGHPAIAWPSIDGDEFIGRPSSGWVTFTKDQSLSDRIIQKLNSGDVTNVNGEPGSNIPFILFPLL